MKVVYDGPSGEQMEAHEDEHGALHAPTERAPAMDARASFYEALDARLDQGAREYKDQSFGRPVGELIAELEQEALDLAGWSFILWQRIQSMRAKAMALAAE